MTKIDLTKITNWVLSDQPLESTIIEYKTFFRTHLAKLPNRDEVLRGLYPLYTRFRETAPPPALVVSQSTVKLELETEAFLKQHFSKEIFDLYKKSIPVPIKPRKFRGPDDSIAYELLRTLSESFEHSAEQNKRNWNYKTNFLEFLYNCLYSFGLHKNILSRDENVYKRYNFVLEHYYKSKNKVVEYKTLISPSILRDEYLAAYEKKAPIRFNGKLVPFKSIFSIKITSTLLLDDEIDLFALKNRFTWNSTTRNYMRFIELCRDETDLLLRNPYLLDSQERFRNQNTSFIDPIRLEELKKIKTKKFDLVKLIRLCEELNSASGAKNNISSSLLTRAIVDHVPPIFGFNNFSSFANQYVDGTRSFKKSMLNLDTSLRNIADNNIHSQVRKKEVLPTTTQIDFTPELDLLLSEVVRHLK